MEKLDRKDFLKLAGGTIAGAVAGGTLGTTLSGAPFLSMQWAVEWTQDQYVPPKGEEKFINSIYGKYPGDTEVSLRMIGDRAVKVNSAEHCADAQLALQMLYHPERIQAPLKRSGKKGYNKYMEISWEDAIKEISSKIDDLIKNNKPDSIAAVDSGKGGLSSLLMERLIATSGSPNIYSEPSFESISGKAVKLTQGVDGSIHYDLENAGYILTFGARIVEGWGDTVSINKAFRSWKENGTRLVHIDSMSTRTASLADQWIPVRPGTEAVLALGIANQLIQKGKKLKGGNQEAIRKIIDQYTLQEVSEITGVGSSVIRKLADEFASASKPIAVAGKGSCEISSTVAEIAAVQCLNALVGNLGAKGGVFVKQSPGIGQLKELKEAGAGIDEFIKKNRVPELLFINGANPAHKSVYGKDIVELMKKSPMVVSIMPFKNDTALYSDYILPSITMLEIENSEGQIPVTPRSKSMYSGDALIKIARNTLSLANFFPWKDHNDAVKTIEGDSINGVRDFVFPADLLKDYLARIKKMTGDSADYPLTMMPFNLRGVGDGSGLVCPYVLKGIDDTILLGNTLWVQMNPETADKNGLSEGSRIDIISRRGALKNLKVHLTKTVAPDVVAVPLGFGQKANTKYAAGKGVNPREIMNDEIDPVSGVADWWLTKVKIS